MNPLNPLPSWDLKTNLEVWKSTAVAAAVKELHRHRVHRATRDPSRLLAAQSSETASVQLCSVIINRPPLGSFRMCEEFESCVKVRDPNSPLQQGDDIFLMLYLTLGFSQTLAGWFLLNLKDVCWCIINSTCFDIRKLLGACLPPAVSNADRKINL